MTRQQLEDAADFLLRASEAASGEAADRLESQAEEFESLAVADRGPDHGKLARHEHILRDVADDVDGDAADHLESAMESIDAYRATIEGV